MSLRKPTGVRHRGAASCKPFAASHDGDRFLRDLTIDDAQALLRASSVRRVAPLLIGTSEISHGGKLRETMLAGTTAEYIDVRTLKLAQGRFLSPGDWRRGAPEAVIGATIRDELFGAEPAVGQLVRIGDRRFRVAGVMASTGQ